MPDKLTELVADLLFYGSTFKGGPGSGHRGHKGRPGQRGGSLPGKRPGGVPGEPLGEWGLQQPVELPEAPVFPPESERPLEELPYDARERRLRKAVESGELTNVETLGGGIRDTYTADLAGFGKVKLKLSKYGAEEEANNELAIAIINHELGNLVPELPVVADFTVPSGKAYAGQSPGTKFLISEFRKGTLLSHYPGRTSKLPPTGVDHVALFDSIIANQDGHGNNYIVDDNRHLIPIDVGISMGGGTLKFMRSESRDARINKGRELLTPNERALLTGFVGREATVTPLLTKYVSSQKASAMWTRVEKMLEKGAL